MKNFHLFKTPLQTWNGPKVYDQQHAELLKQIDELIMLQSGLGQSSQGHPEDYEHRDKLQKEVEALQGSIKIALQM